MRASFAIALAVVGVGASAASADFEVVDSPGYFMQFQGTLTPCDLNPIAGGFTVPDQPETDEDPDYDWLILETMVSVPIHEAPFYLWPGSEHVEGPYTHEMGFAMGLVLVWRDVNGSDPSEWGKGELLLLGDLGMTHQEDDSHSSMSFWIDTTGDGPWPFEFLGTMHLAWGGSWLEEYGPGYIIKGSGYTTWVEGGFDNHQTGVIERYQIEPMAMHLGDMNLNGLITYDDVPAFMRVLFGEDHDESRHILADMNRDEVLDLHDALIFLDILLRNGGDG